ncbi:Rrf2 family protein [Nonomuraea thailandensis]|uniref:Rrf2 family protein n=1 Tax=Nonomuraea thailandensis TaxID=1188745 RepID=A0A9X2GH13_9ACTN|nr:Rrf2 family transcriptional regulator [Nonomuraea thailandensis]MCP2358964.1 Rrf2 family protein [Nonomuraea thailandensis]
MRISARTQYALGAMLALAVADSPVHAERIAVTQDIPRRFCDNILLQLRRAGLIRSQRGPDGGYWLARPPGEIALADVIRVTEGAEQALRPFSPAAAPLAEIWDRLRSHEDALLSEITLADVVASRDRQDGRADSGGLPDDPPGPHGVLGAHGLGGRGAL